MTSDPEPIDWEPYRERLERLSERERELLKLAGKGYKAKEIARQLDSTFHAVNKAIQKARERLGGELYRTEAGRMVAAYEATLVHAQSGGYSLAPQKLDLPQPDNFGPDEPANVQADAQAPQAEPPALEQDAFSSLLRLLARRDILTLRKSGRQDNDLKLIVTLAVIAAVAVLALVLAGSAASLLTALNSAYT
ncbi:MULTISPECIES: sigma factor-like helix-turn-helix DNA-binding protein [Sphingobium]|uniref:sigma factor-like helix-turn-helix DNA-binding protein n=1 Tax=Sphingobium TaxID=165695 RepID=UPI001239C120|nr:sigma factor-like helix-turn-helix DNA-binding protein [Sphingobium estronivorans]